MRINPKKLMKWLFVISILVLSGILLLSNGVQSKQSNSVLTAVTVTPRNISLEETTLIYPGATKLAFDEKELWPNGLPDDIKDQKVAFFATNANYQQVASFYKQKLSEIGYSISNDASVICCQNVCDASRIISGSNSKFVIATGAYSFKSWSAKELDGRFSISAIPTKVINQLKNNQTLVFYAIAPNVGASGK